MPAWRKPPTPAKKDDASDNGLKKLTIPSVEMGGGSIGVSTDKPNDPNVPAFRDPTIDDRKAEPFVGLKFTKPLERQVAWRRRLDAGRPKSLQNRDEIALAAAAAGGLDPVRPVGD